MVDVDRITVDMVNEALHHIKDGKKDVLYDFSSECFTNAPQELTQYIVNKDSPYMGFHHYPDCDC